MTEKRVVHVERWIPSNDAESWRECVDQLLGPAYIGTREADLESRRHHARLLAIAALRAADDDELAGRLARAMLAASA